MQMVPGWFQRVSDRGFSFILFYIVVSLFDRSFSYLLGICDVYIGLTQQGVLQAFVFGFPLLGEIPRFACMSVHLYIFGFPLLGSSVCIRRASEGCPYTTSLYLYFPRAFSKIMVSAFAALFSSLARSSASLAFSASSFAFWAASFCRCSPSHSAQASGSVKTRA